MGLHDPRRSEVQGVSFVASKPAHTHITMLTLSTFLLHYGLYRLGTSHYERREAEVVALYGDSGGRNNGSIKSSRIPSSSSAAATPKKLLGCTGGIGEYGTRPWHPATMNDGA